MKSQSLLFQASINLLAVSLAFDMLTYLQAIDGISAPLTPFPSPARRPEVIPRTGIDPAQPKGSQDFNFRVYFHSQFLFVALPSGATSYSPTRPT